MRFIFGYDFENEMLGEFFGILCFIRKISVLSFVRCLLVLEFYDFILFDIV